MIRRELGILLLVVLLASPAAAQELTGTLKQIKKSGQIRIGYRESEPPMSFLDQDGQPAGYSIDICKEIVAGVETKIGAQVNVKYVPVTAKGRFEALRANKIDILCGATTMTLSRSEWVDFTLLTFITGASLMTLKDNPTVDSAGLAGTRIGVVKATTTEAALKKLLRDTATDAKVVLFDDAQAGVEALRRKQIDAFSSDQVVLIGLALKYPDGKNFVIKSEVYSFEPFALALRRNDADFRLAANRTISGLHRSGKTIAIYDQWIGKFTRNRLPIFDALIQLNAIPE
ncbi:MAG: amino acid ABC transporter substrate-binding protein [Desulfobacterales bacterium]|nr:amino acid ABC transporter substrate-binding protein [Desulfobacterales bacterium]